MKRLALLVLALLLLFSCSHLGGLIIREKLISDGCSSYSWSSSDADGGTAGYRLIQTPWLPNILIISRTGKDGAKSYEESTVAAVSVTRRGGKVASITLDGETFRE
jgi:hypothetical protein